MGEPVRVEGEDGIRLLTIDRPEARNALDRDTLEALERALAAAARAPEVGVVILTGAGDQVFVSGAHVGEVRERTKQDGLEGHLNRLLEDLERHPKVTIAAVNGYALGGGFELALACDLRVASARARFGFPETGLGIIPGAGGTQRLPRFVGLGRAKHLILTGELVDAEEARAIGLVSRVVAPGELLPAARELAARVLERGPLALRLAKAAVDLTAEAPRRAGYLFETVAQALLYETRDKREGTSAFLEKRKPRFTGE